MIAQHHQPQIAALMWNELLQVQHGAELRAGAKRTHWMWFVFPQHAALGRSPMAVNYGIRSAAEAAAYLDHPVLGVGRGDPLRSCPGGSP